jgi:hypothetical protein
MYIFKNQKLPEQEISSKVFFTTLPLGSMPLFKTSTVDSIRTLCIFNNHILELVSLMKSKTP